MSGGITQLVAIGAQDVHLTGNPEVSFFRSTYKRHTNFSMTTERQVIQGAVSANNMSSVRFERKGDLLGYVYLAAHNGSKSQDIDWSTVINKIQFLVGGQIIDEHDFRFSSTIAPHVLAQNLAKSDAGILPNNANSYFYPLRFFFCENWQSALPLIALQYHDIELRIYWGSDVVSPTGWDTTGSMQYECYANFVYLDSDERMALSNQTQNMLIYQVQKSIASGSSKVQDLAFNHPIKYLVSSNATSLSTGGLFSASNKVKLQLNGTDVADYKFSVPHFTKIMSYYSVPYSSDNADDLFLFPFCLDTSKIQPTGSLNFSRLDSARIISQSDNITDDVYAVNYNILRIQAGMGGLVYAN
jgi:hypothetical protein